MQLFDVLSPFEPFDSLGGPPAPPPTGQPPPDVGDLSAIETGPCALNYKGLDVGHTMEGVVFSIAPDLRARMVDETGDYEVDLIAQGDSAEVKATLAEKTLQTVQQVYQFGSLATSTLWGVGRRPGTKGSAMSGVLILHPIDSGVSTASDVTFFKAVVGATNEVQFGTITADRVFQATFRMLIDTTRGDGQLIGTLGLARG